MKPRRDDHAMNGMEMSVGLGKVVHDNESERSMRTESREKKTNTGFWNDDDAYDESPDSLCARA